MGDPDLEGLRSVTEWEAGTDPCNPDTDFGGESDASEVERGANPFDPQADALPAPIDPEVIDYLVEHLPFPGGVALKPGVNLIRYPANPLYQRVRLWRGTTPDTLKQVAEFDAGAQGGLYPDEGLVNGSTYYYRIQPLGLSDEVGAFSILFSGTPAAEPVPPVGSVIVQDGVPQVDDVNVTLSFAVSSDTQDVMVTNTPGLDPTAWQPYQPLLPWTLAPTNGRATVYVRFRDANGNVSPSLYSASVTVLPPGSLGALSGRVALPKAGDPAGTRIVVRGRPEIPPVYTDGDGAFVLGDLLPNTYTLEVTRAGFETVVLADLVVTAGADTEVEGVELTAAPSSGAAAVPLPPWAGVCLLLALLGLALRLGLRAAAPGPGAA